MKIDDIKNDSTLSEKEKTFAIAMLTAVEDLHKKSMLGIANEEYVNKQIAEVKGELSKFNTKSIQDQLDALTVKYEELKLGTPKPQLSLKEQIINSLKSKEFVDAVKAKQPYEMTVKVANNMSFTNNTTNAVGRIDFLPGIRWDAERGVMLSNLIPAYPANGHVIYYNDAYDKQGEPSFVNDATASDLMSWKFIQREAAVKDVSVYGVWSTNMMDDIDNFAAQVEGKLMEQLMLKYDEKLLSGDAGSNPAEFNGLSYYAPTFSLPDNALKTYKPNLRDVLNAACAQVESNKFKPNFALLHPVEVRSLLNDKTSEGQYQLPWNINPVLVLDGLIIVSNTGITKGNFLVGDYTKAEQHVRSEVNIVYDPYTLSTSRMVRVTFTKRAAFFVSANNVNAFVEGSIATAKAALTKTS